MTEASCELPSDRRRKARAETKNFEAEEVYQSLGIKKANLNARQVFQEVKGRTYAKLSGNQRHALKKLLKT